MYDYDLVMIPVTCTKTIFLAWLSGSVLITFKEAISAHLDKIRRIQSQIKNQSKQLVSD